VKDDEKKIMESVTKEKDTGSKPEAGQNESETGKTREKIQHYTAPKIFDVPEEDKLPARDAVERLEKRLKAVEMHARTDYKFLAYMALLLAALSFFFTLVMYNRTASMNSRLNSSVENAMKLQAQTREAIEGFEERLGRTEIDYNRYIRVHLNEYLDEMIIKLTTLRYILDEQKQVELEQVIDRIQNIKNGVSSK